MVFSLAFCYIPAKALSPYNPFAKEAPDLEPLKRTISQELGVAVTDAKLLGRGWYNAVYEMYFKDANGASTSVVARVTYNFKTDGESMEWTLDKLRREALVHELVRSLAPRIPVPKILFTRFDFQEIGAPFSVMEKLVGEDQWLIWPKLSSQEKETFIRSFAQVSVDIFKISMPRIGALQEIEAGTPIVGPFLKDPVSRVHSYGPFEDLVQYMSDQIDWFCSQKHNLPESTLKTLFGRLKQAVLDRTSNDPSFLRPVLMHCDMESRNILANSQGVITGVLDWESHCVLPAAIAVSYPAFIRFDGMFASKYNLIKRAMPTPDSWPSEAESRHFRNIYRQAATSLSPEYVQALDYGEPMRHLWEFVKSGNADACITWLDVEGGRAD